MSTRMGNTWLFHFFIFNETPYLEFVLQSSDAPIDSVQEFIEYLQIKIFDLECKVNHYEESERG